MIGVWTKCNWAQAWQKQQAPKRDLWLRHRSFDDLIAFVAPILALISKSFGLFSVFYIRTVCRRHPQNCNVSKVLIATQSVSFIMTNNSTVNPSEVGWQFVPQYYTFVNKQPNRLHCFYTKASTFVHGTEGEDVKACFGQQVCIFACHQLRRAAARRTGAGGRAASAAVSKVVPALSAPRTSCSS